MEKFTLFPHLPRELRLKIWRLTFPGPRNVGVRILIKNAGFGGWALRPESPLPPLALQICQESRAEAQRYYSLCFGTAAYPATIYFNYQIDTLCFGSGVEDLGPDVEERGPSDYLLNMWFGKTFSRYKSAAGLVGVAAVVGVLHVRFLTLEVEADLYDRPGFVWDEVRRFEGLEELVLVIWEREERREERIAYFRRSMGLIKEKNLDWVVPRTVVMLACGDVWECLQEEQNVAQS